MSLNLEQVQGGTFVFSKAALGIGSTASQLATGAAVNYAINGVWAAQKAATASFALVVPPITRVDPITQASVNVYAYATVPVGSKSAFAVWLDSAGTFYVTQGPVVSASSNTDRAPIVIPPADYALVGVATVYNASLSANGGFRPGTDAFNAAGLTTTYFDTCTLAGRNF